MMEKRVDPNLHRELKKFGADDLDVCFSCGNCTATCPLSGDDLAFPRRIIHFAQVGMTDKLRASVDPWLCYYCGECSESCPREANPGENMMAARRYLTASYDWTGLSKKLYLSITWEISAILAVALGVVALFYFFHGPIVTDRVELNTFAPVEWVHIGDLIMAGVLSFFLLTNALRMFYFVVKDSDVHIPFSLLVTQIPTFILHFATQKRWRECDDEDHMHWFKHLLLVSGYLTMLVLVLGLLKWFQTDEVYPFYHPQRLLGYYATAVLMYITVDFMIGRWKKNKEIHKFSHASDWIFLILLFLTAFTGILVNIFRVYGLAMPTYIIYVIHMAIAVPMLMVEVPFGKWAHLFYRPLAMYLYTVKQKAKEVAKKQKQAAAKAAKAAKASA